MKILEALYPDEAEYYRNHREALESGYEFQYEWIVEHFSEGLNSEACKEVLDILEMYHRMIMKFRELNNDQKAEIGIEEVIFPGFDGNNETSQLNYAIYFMHNLNRFGEVREDTEFPDYDSHTPTLRLYRDMLRLFNNVMESDHELSFINLKELIEMQPLSMR